MQEMTTTELDLTKVSQVAERRAVLALWNDYEAKFDALDAKLNAHLFAARAEFDAAHAAERDAVDAAWQAYKDHPLEFSDERLCALSGLPILDDDETLEDTETGDEVLRVLVIPPRPSEDADVEDEAA